MKQQAIAAALAAALMVTAGAAAAQPAGQAPQALTRAEVMADRDMWIAAGLANYAAAQNYAEVVQSADYQQRLAVYQRLRHGPEFAAATQRHARRALH